MEIKPGWQLVVGLEIHAQLNSRSKIFCPDPVEFGGDPNTLVSVISLGHPGALPSLNRQCVEMAILMGMATDCQIRRESIFARKNYFYPDLSKGYQISQHDTPICHRGKLPIRLADGTEKVIGITRIHLEEDAGKNLHDQDIYDSLVDFNRCGTGLIEIVSEPDIRTPEEAGAYIAEVRKIVRYLGICDGNMEEGSLRVDANISVMRTGTTQFGTRCEVKNMNSISNVQRAIVYEANRQIEILENGGTIIQQTRTWDSVNGKTLLLREKENADDYRYFPEPDLQPLRLTEEQLATVKAKLPALPRQRYQRYTTEFALPDFDATMLTEQREFAEYFEAAIAHTPDPRGVSKWMNGPVKTYLNEQAVEITQFPVPPTTLAEVVGLVNANKVSFTAAKEQLFPLLMQQPDASAAQLAQAHSLLLETSDEDIRTEIERLLDANPDKVATYLGGKTGLLGFFVGQVMKTFQGKADPKAISELTTQALDNRRSQQ
jgi:aspartyl-tRNA(Asn)/glutamyl-tRNA(Gln) amidotransferase subunit B